MLAEMVIRNEKKIEVRCIALLSLVNCNNHYLDKHMLTL